MLIMTVQIVLWVSNFLKIDHLRVQVPLELPDICNSIYI